jgi:hypothetical protein
LTESPLEAQTAAPEQQRRHDRFGNEFARDLPYARGQILSSTEDDFSKLEVVSAHLRRRLEALGPDAVYNFSGLEHGLPLEADELRIAHDFLAPGVAFQRFRTAALDHLGGNTDTHDARYSIA